MVLVRIGQQPSDSNPLSEGSGESGSMPSATDAQGDTNDEGQEATDRLVEELTERAELAERMEEASWFQNQPDTLFLAGVLAIIPSVWAVRRALRRRRRRLGDARSPKHTR